MDLALIGRVLWRFRFLVVFGLIAALALAFLSYVRVRFDDGSPTLFYRGSELWQSDSILLVTQSGFPWGRSVTAEPEPVGEDVTVVKPPRFADKERFEALASLYAALATSDDVRDIILETGPIDGALEASPVLASELVTPEFRSQLRVNEPLPLVRISGLAKTPQGANALAARAVDAFGTYLEEKQSNSQIPESKRVLVTTLVEPKEAELVEGRSRIYPALIAVGVVALTVGLAFALENLRPRARKRDTAQGALAARSSASHGPQ